MLKNIVIYNKKLLKKINEINYHFANWIEGNFEDDPLPYEIKYILFLFSLKNNIINLNFSGGEQLSTINQPLEYFPLEIQFFNFNGFYNFFKYYFIYKTNKSAKTNLRKCFCFTFIKAIILTYLSGKNKIIANKIVLLGYELEDSSKCINIQKSK